VVLEAMACGVPVAAAKAGGLGELVRAGETGWTAEPGDSDGLAGAMLDALRDAGRRASVAGAARERSRGFTVESMADRMEAVYMTAAPR
jgi:glycosyltransferase involved in cell wall biosynthesis